MIELYVSVYQQIRLPVIAGDHVIIPVVIDDRHL